MFRTEVNIPTLWSRCSLTNPPMQMTRLIIPVIVALLVSGAAWAKELSGACVATSLTFGFPNEKGATTQGSTERFRFEAGNVFHQWEGREEYRYGPIAQLGTNPYQYTSGNMRFIFATDQKGYVIHGDKIGWKISNLDCAISR